MTIQRSALGRAMPFMLVAVALAACNGAKADDGATAEVPPSILRRDDILIVDSTLVESGPILSGTLRPKAIATLRAQVGGRVIDVYAEQGQQVRQGELLVSLDPAALNEQLLAARASVRSAEATAELARRNLERSQRLAQAGAIADRDVEQNAAAVDQAQAAVDDAKARLRAVEEQLIWTRVRSPFAGSVAEQPVNPGDVVQVGAALMTVVNPSLLELEATVPVEALPTLRPGAEVTFATSALAERRFTGTVDRVNPAVDPATRQLQLYVNVPNRQGRLVAGLFAEGRVSATKLVTLAVPFAAVDQRDGGATVRRVRGGRVESVPVTLGLRDEVAEKVQVTAGVAQGDTLLVGGALTISAGTPVRLQADK
jgi:RND family efflux transporter MFP subunit